MQFLKLCKIHIKQRACNSLCLKDIRFVFSVGCVGCNFRCSNCQNWEIAQIKGNKCKYGENIAGKSLENTRRHKCQKTVIERAGYRSKL